MAERITVSLRDETASELERYIAELNANARKTSGSQDAAVSRSRLVDRLILEAIEGRRQEVTAAR